MDTQLLAANGSVSDVLLYEVVNGQPSYQVTFGSAPDLPVIPPSAVDLTTIGVQGLPADPYYENGAVQQVGTSFETDPVSGNDTFFIQSNAASASPEPGTIALIASGFAVIAIRRRKTVL
jgi:hypothetical protein